MENIRVIVSFKIKSEGLEYANPYLTEFVNASRLEDGNLSIEIFQSTDKPNQFWFVELWESKEAVLAHTRSEHFKTFSAFFVLFTKDIKVNQMVKMPI